MKVKAMSELEDWQLLVIDSKRKHGTCDYCKVRSVNAFVKDKSLLTFCGHHSNKYEEVLMKQQWKKISLVDIII